MAYIDVPDGLPGIRALLAFRPETAIPLSALADALLHAPNSLPPGDREMIAAYVSGLSDCTFCLQSHAAVAAFHVQNEALVASVVRDPERAPIPEKLKALLALAARVQRGGRAVQEEDVARARHAGASDVEIHDAVLIAAAFCMFNRYVDGLGTFAPTDKDGYRAAGAALGEHGYSNPPLAADVPAATAGQSQKR